MFHSNGGRRQCCGKGTYDTSSQECCHGTNFSKAMQKGQQICCDGIYNSYITQFLVMLNESNNFQYQSNKF